MRETCVRTLLFRAAGLSRRTRAHRRRIDNVQELPRLARQGPGRKGRLLGRRQQGLRLRQAQRVGGADAHSCRGGLPRRAGERVELTALGGPRVERPKRE